MSVYEHYTIFDPSATRFAAALFVIDKTNSYAYQVGEILVQDPSQMSVGKIWPRVQELEQLFFPHWADPIRIYDEAAKFFAVEISDQFGIAVAPTQKRYNEKSNNISTVRDAMFKKRFIIADHCTDTIQEIYNYHIDDKGRIVKRKDDLVDCILYFFAESAFSFQGEPEQELGEEDRRFYTPEEDYMSRDEDSDFAPSHDNIMDEEDVEGSLWDGITLF